MSMLNARRSLDPRWQVHHRSVPQGWMTVDVRIERQDADPVWDPDTNELSDGGLTVLWEGPARVQDNKDWRVRNIASASDPQKTHFARVQIPLRAGGVPPHFRPADIVRILPPQDPDSQWGQMFDSDLLHWTLRVRNSMNSSHPWVRNLLCVADLSESDQPLPEVGS